MTYPGIPLFIAGQRRASWSGETYEVVNPLTGDVVHTVAAATAEDCKSAIDSANNAFDPWRRMSPEAKAKVFGAAAKLVSSDTYSSEITDMLTKETGWVVDYGKWMNVYYVEKLFLEACDMVSAPKGSVIASDIGAQSYVRKVPMGVIFIMAPWNAPLLLSLFSMAPALAAGNTVVLKTSEHSPGSQLILGKLLQEAGLPDGVLNIVHTTREDATFLVPEMIAHPAVRKISFTGSARVGTLIAAEAAKHLKPCIFELGGKAPAVVLKDANVETAARAIASGAFLGSGQICISTERVIVQREVSERLIEHLKRIISNIRAGDPSTSDARIGRLLTPQASDNVIAMIKESISAGAKLLVGDLRADGTYVQPHVVLGAKPGQRLWEQESFGPVFTISVVDTVDEAVELANATQYSLSSSLWTNDLETAMEVSARIRASQVIVNGPTYMVELKAKPQGMGGLSGYGEYAVESFLYAQMVSIQSTESQQAYLLSDF